jgi:glucoamylase
MSRALMQHLQISLPAGNKGGSNLPIQERGCGPNVHCSGRDAFRAQNLPTDATCGSGKWSLTWLAVASGGRQLGRVAWICIFLLPWRAAGAGTDPLSGWIAQQEVSSWQHLLENISPRLPKHPGEPPPVPGIVVAALQIKDPDYYFHWVRDSALVMHTVAEAFELQRPYTSRALFERQFDDFLKLSRHLQDVPSPFGLGEPRFTVSGAVDPLPWSRPQYDGPALRALSVLEYFKAESATQLSDPERDALAMNVLRTDLDYLTTVWNQRGFDVWEELRADNYQTRLVQLAALEQGADWLERRGASPEQVARYRNVAHLLEPLLDDHWDPTRGFLRSQLAIVATDGYTAKKTDLDSEVIVAVVDADQAGDTQSVLDDRVQATVAVLEDLFRESFPINHRANVGLGYGRYRGDTYYGGNAFVFITADFATFYYRLARRLKDGASLTVTSRNLAFLRSALPDSAGDLKVGVDAAPGSALHDAAVEAFAHKADLILERLRLSTPADGQMYEQIDKRTGLPASSRGTGWSHAAFLTAVYEREQLQAVAAQRLTRIQARQHSD